MNVTTSGPVPESAFAYKITASFGNLHADSVGPFARWIAVHDSWYPVCSVSSVAESSLSVRKSVTDPAPIFFNQNMSQSYGAMMGVQFVASMGKRFFK